MVDFVDNILAEDDGVYWIFFVSILTLNMLIFTPMLIYYLIGFLRRRHTDYIAKRRPKMLLMLTCSALTESLLFRPLVVLEALLDIKLLLAYGIFEWFAFITFLLAYFYVGRTYLLIYDFMRSKHMLDLKWKSLLVSPKAAAIIDTQINYKEMDIDNDNDTENDDETKENDNDNESTYNDSRDLDFDHSVTDTDRPAVQLFTGTADEIAKLPWTLKYPFLGDTYKVALSIFLFWVCITTMLYIILVWYTSLIAIVQLFVVFLSVLGLILIFLKFKFSCQDSLNLYQELRNTTIFFVGIYVSGLTIMVLFSIEPYTIERHLFLYGFISLAEFGLLILSFSPRDPDTDSKSKNKRMNGSIDNNTNNNTSMRYKMGQTIKQSAQNLFGIENKRNHKGSLGSGTSTMSRSRLEALYGVKKADFEKILNNKDGFRAFANYCVTEFSVENVLFLLEYMQLKAQLKRFKFSFLIKFCFILGFFIVCFTFLASLTSRFMVMQSHLPVYTSKKELNFDV